MLHTAEVKHNKTADDRSSDDNVDGNERSSSQANASKSRLPTPQTLTNVDFSPQGNTAAGERKLCQQWFMYNSESFIIMILHLRLRLNLRK